MTEDEKRRAEHAARRGQKTGTNHAQKLHAHLTNNGLFWQNGTQSMWCQLGHFPDWDLGYPIFWITLPHEEGVVACKWPPR